MKRSGIQVTKHVYMALINAYAACGQCEKAKQVLHILYRFLQVLSQLQSIFFPTREPKPTIDPRTPRPR